MRDAETLRRVLAQLDGRGYASYKQLVAATGSVSFGSSLTTCRSTPTLRRRGCASSSTGRSRICHPT